MFGTEDLAGGGDVAVHLAIVAGLVIGVGSERQVAGGGRRGGGRRGLRRMRRRWSIDWSRYEWNIYETLCVEGMNGRHR